MRTKRAVAVIVVLTIFLQTCAFPNVARAEDNGYNVPVSLLETKSKTIQIRPEGNTGSATYDIPFVTPPGRNGIEPSLSLSYNSNTSDNTGLYGYGWSVGIPAISRLNKEGVNNLYTQNTFTSSLDGELVLITAGSPAIYRAKYDSGAYNTYAYTGTAWTITGKDGTVFKLGSTAASRQDDIANTANVYQWMLDEVRDTNNNFARYTYFKNAGQIYPDSIFYTGSGSTDGIFEVNFIREARVDTVPSYKTAFAVTSNYRIKQVIAKKSGTWVRKYDLGYGTGVNGVRSVLSTVVESGRDEQGNVVTLPATQLAYQQPTVGWQVAPNWSISIPLIDTAFTPDNGVRFAEVNGDGLPDIIKASGPTPAQCYNKQTALNTGTAWNTITTALVPTDACFLAEDTLNHNDFGLRVGDVNGDGMDDLVEAHDDDDYNQTPSENKQYKKVFVKGPTDYVWNSAYSIPDGFGFSSLYSGPNNVSFADWNGDGRADIMSTYFGNGVTLGWKDSVTWTDGAPYTNDGRFGDFNGDGLLDSIEWSVVNNVTVKALKLNSAKGFLTSAITVPGAYPFSIDGSERVGSRIADINADGLPDIIESATNAGGTNVQSLFTNTGTTFNTGTYNLPSDVVFSSWNGVTGQKDGGWRILDINGDSLPDLVGAIFPGGVLTNKVYLNTGKKADLLTSVTLPQGGSVSYTYKSSLAYKDGSGNLVNTGSPYPVTTVDTITIGDGSGYLDTKTYFYEGISQYFNAYNDKQFAGFNIITVTDSAGNKTKTYYHQGNTTDTTNGEVLDHPSKIGKPYRIARYASNGSLYSLEVLRWIAAVAGNQFFVQNTQVATLIYEGDASHKDTVKTRAYNTTNGNIFSESEWGEVNASPDGTYVDTGTDKRVTEYTYATDTAGKILNKVSRQLLKDQLGVIQSEARRYYDAQPLGTVTIGNETKTEQLLSGATYASTQRTFNSYGLVSSIINPRNYTTTLTYDAQNLYPATSTNPLTHATTYQYNQIIGKPKLVTDANTYSVETTYDALGRVVSVRASDNSAPASLITSKTLTYTDTRNANSVYERTYITGSLSQDSYTYADGLGRVIQKRVSNEGGKYSVADATYGRDGTVTSQSLPYASIGGSKTSPSTNSALATSFVYDALNRVVSSVNALGTTATSYTDWKKTIVDAKGKQKMYETDARGSVYKVTEFVGSTPNVTTYTYDTKNNLSTIQDAGGNVRAFTYDKANRRTSAEDLHAPADSTFGNWNFVYDAQGNKTQETQPSGTVVNYAYDALDRLTSEDATNVSGIEASYTYDIGTYGKGRLSTATRGTTTSTYTYTVRGDVAEEQRVIGGETFTTNFDYTRTGDISTITTPDSAQVKYTYNQTGRIEKIQRKESGGTWVDVVSNYDYGPHGQFTLKQLANNTWTYHTYDSNEMYRLKNISTIDPPAEDVTPVAEIPIVPAEQSLVVPLAEEVVASPEVQEVQIQEEIKAITAPQSPLPEIAVEPEEVSDSIKTPTIPDEQNTSDTPKEIVTDVVEKKPEVVVEKPSNTEDFPKLLSLVHTKDDTEIEKARTENSYTIRVGRDEQGNETRVTRLFSAPVHYKDAEGKLQPIDTRIRKDAEGYKVRDARYALDIKTDISVELATFTVGKLAVAIESQYEKSRNSNATKSAQIREKNGKMGSRTEKEEREIGEKNAYGDGIDIVLRADNNFVAKDVVIQNADALKNLNDADATYDVSFMLRVQDDVELLVGDTSIKDTMSTTANARLLKGEDSVYIFAPKIWDSENKKLQITVEYTKVPGGYLLTKHIPKEWLVKAVYPVTTDAILSYSSDIADGAVGNYSPTNSWSDSHDASVGAYPCTSSCGPTASNAQYSDTIERLFVPFNTDALPDTANITGANLKLYSTYVNYAWDPNAYLVVVPTTQASPTALVLNDFDQSGTTELSARVNSANGTFTSPDWKTFALNATGIGSINLTGWTKIGLRSGYDKDNVPPTSGFHSYAFRMSEYTGTDFDPYLEVTYSLPTIPPTATDLKVESLSNPTTVTTGTPKFTATFNDPDLVDSGAHYAVQVIPEGGNWATPLWDSQKSALPTLLNQGDRTPNITYGGTALQLNGTKYLWRIRFWDTGGTQGPWSDGSDYFVVTTPQVVQSYLYSGCLTAQDGALNPVELKCGAPVFSGIFNLGASGTVAHKYRMQVATSADFSTGILWDSGAAGTSLSATSFGARTSDIVYAGAPLTFNGTKYYWRIKFWTTGNSETDWSTTGTFTTYTSKAYQYLSYAYDAVGNITAIGDASDTNTKKNLALGYDDLYRLTSATASNALVGTNYAHTFAYDALGSITNKSDTGAYSYAGTGYANPHAVTTIGASSYTYDNNGNVVSDGVRTYVWNYNNTLASVTKGGVTTTYGYDTSKQRVSHTSGTLTTKYPNKFYNKDSTGKKTKHIFAGDTVVATIETVGTTVTPYYLHTDTLGSSSAITSDIVQYNRPPKVSVIGESTVIVAQNATYTEQGASAIDTEDGTLTQSIVTTGAVNTATTGTYVKTYSVTDSGGSTDTKIRTVIVRAPNPADTIPTPLVQWKYTGAQGSTSKLENSINTSTYPLTSNGYTSVAGKEGTADTAAYLNGTSDNLAFTPYSPATSDFTVAVRFKTVWPLNYASSPLFFEGTDVNNYSNIYMYVNSNMQGNCHVGGTTLNTSTVPVYDNNWHDMVCLRRGNTIELYFDNVLQSSSTPSQVTNLSFTGTTAYLGKSNTGGVWSYHKGTLDEVKILAGTGLTQSQIPGIFAPQTNTPPVLTLSGTNPTLVSQGSTYVDSGATATDTEDGTVTPTVTGTVNTAVQGTYTRTYTATDSGGQSVTQTRTVAVVPPGPLIPNEVQTIDYYPYGDIRQNTKATSFDIQRKYIGELYDDTAQLSYLNARYYNPSTGQFVSQDPVAQTLGINNISQQLLLDP
ncbi:MAG: immunoglobulin-like domain-containing protein, partial [Minisyncoccia bacterium]